MSKTATPRSGWLALLATLALTTPAIAQTTSTDAGRPSVHPSRNPVNDSRAEGDTAGTRAGPSQGEKGVIPGAGIVSARRTNAQSDGPPFKIEPRSARAPASQQSPQPASTSPAKDSPAVGVREQTQRATSGEAGMPNRISMNASQRQSAPPRPEAARTIRSGGDMLPASQRQSAPPRPEAPSLTIKTKSVPD